MAKKRSNSKTTSEEERDLWEVGADRIAKMLQDASLTEGSERHRIRRNTASTSSHANSLSQSQS